MSGSFSIRRIRFTNPICYRPCHRHGFAHVYGLCISAASQPWYTNTMTLALHPVPMRTDNYAWLVSDTESDLRAIIDPCEEQPALEALRQSGGHLALILLTHHHDDHIAAAAALRERTGALIAGAAADADRLPRLDHTLHEGNRLPFGTLAEFQVINTPGHTRGHISYFMPQGPFLFCGDTLFSLGCGRLFEGTPEDMFKSLRKIATLPADTLIACGHEYTSANARFALHVDPDNAVLQRRTADVTRMRASGQPSLPVTLAQELATNPFLRASNPHALGELRQMKDRF
ncbi:Hydroxyacylglutathione hydrolase [Granulibacter bethesdensis]|uniref:Hydroxyacylglutathione hydrolase n=2 Tax=Granulibacter bethesdensis TaxID=364410 RepID=A0AAN0VF63_9PROT|nr:Hydroxyacylglutathione hydrolase [Granulibacter bethesdensis]